MIWIVTSITGSIIGSATSKWFDKTQLGRWFNKKIETWYNWAAKRYGLKIMKGKNFFLFSSNINLEISYFAFPYSEKVFIFFKNFGSM